jgi:TonB family protein
MLRETFSRGCRETFIFARMLHLKTKIAFVLLSIGIGVARLGAAVSLHCVVDGMSLPVVAVEGRRVFVEREGRKILVPAGVRYLLEGDLAGAASVIRWSPGYEISFQDASRPGGTALKPHGNTSVIHRTQWAEKKQDSAFIKAWPAAVDQPGLLVGAWLVHGKITQVAAEPTIAATADGQFFVSLDFDLGAEELEGQAIQLFWTSKGFLPAAARFEDPAAERVLEAMLLENAKDFSERLAALKDVEVRGRSGETLLLFAAESGWPTAIDGLLARGARPNPKRNAVAPLAWAASKGRVEAVRKLLAAKAWSNGSDDDGRPSPLLEAISHRHIQTAEVLIEAGADPSKSDSMRRSALGDSIDLGLADVVARMDRKVPLEFWRNDQASNVLVTQAAMGHTAMVKFLLRKRVRADVSVMSQTALMAGATNGDQELAEALVSAKVKVNAVDDAGRSALLDSVWAGNKAYAQVLLAAGADRKQRTMGGIGCLDFAAARNDPELLKLLWADSPGWPGAEDLEKGLRMALHASAGSAAKELIQRGATLTLTGNDRDLLVAEAIILDLPTVVRDALTAGWSANTILAGEWSALKLAGAFNARECSKVLRAAGAHEPGGTPFVAVRQLDARPALLQATTISDPRDIDGFYPEERIEVEMIIDSDGKVRFPRVHSATNRGLAVNALTVVQGWTFKPLTHEGKPASTRAILPIRFPSSEQRVTSESKVEQLPVVIKRVPPTYPMNLRRKGVQGRVTLRFTVGVDGRVHDVGIQETTDPEFCQPAIESVQQWTFKPGLVDNKPVNTRMTQPITFSIQWD